MNEMKLEPIDVPSATEPDWSRETPRRFFDPSRRLLRSIRHYQRWSRCTGMLSIAAAIMKRRWLISHRFWSVVTSADIPLNCQIEGGLLLPHPSGVVVHPDARIGPNCMLGAHAVIGVGKRPGLPVLMGNVDVHAGGCVLGGVVVGEHTQVGANAVVIGDVPKNSTAIGAPARIIARKDSCCGGSANQALRVNIDTETIDRRWDSAIEMVASERP